MPSKIVFQDGGDCAKLPNVTNGIDAVREAQPLDIIQMVSRIFAEQGLKLMAEHGELTSKASGLLQKASANAAKAAPYIHSRKMAIHVDLQQNLHDSQVIEHIEAQRQRISARDDETEPVPPSPDFVSDGAVTENITQYHTTLTPKAAEDWSTLDQPATPPKGF